MENIKNMKFEDALKELERVVQALEGGKASLDESVELYEKGTLLKKHCEERLKSAQLRVNQIADGNEIKPFSTDGC